MSNYRQLRPKRILEQQESKLSDRPLTIIARQSTTHQVEENKESFRLQIEDARQRFISQGWSQDIITIRIAGDGKKGVSGTLRIDQRSELIDTIVDIKAGSCKAVGAYSISRLFRDKFGVEVTTFMKICAEYDVLVILPDKTFNFRNDDDVTMFTIYARFAAIDNEQRKKLLRESRFKKALRGAYDGRFITIGFIVDRDKNSPTYDRFIEYAPHARVVRRLYARFRELGAFNLLAAEVAQLPYVFPDFEEWVDERNKRRFILKRVPGGYHISRTSLMHLLTAIEYVGYWHVKGELLTDAQGQPLVNHTPIVPMDDWQYAYTHLSFQTLDGLPNPQRTQGSTWTPATKQGRDGTLHGILSSPLGSVSCSAGYYRIAEHRPGHSQSSDTLSMAVEVIDTIFQERLSDRLMEIDQNALFYDHVKKLKKQHAKELLTIPEQIAGYERERGNIQAYIKAVGATADTATLQQYNADLLEIAATIAALEAKKKQAAAKESSIARLRERVAAMRRVLGEEGANEDSLGFLRLLCDAVALDEYSSHFVTLTIAWAAPFQRVDVCFIYRPTASRQEWTPAEEETLHTHFCDSDRLDILKTFPTRSWFGIQVRAKKLGLVRTHDYEACVIPRALSYKDWLLLQEHEWTLPAEGHAGYWVYDVDHTFETSLQTKQR